MNYLYILTIISLFTSLPAAPLESPKIILVLGSGGSRALAHVGVIEELERLGVIPDMIVGCSSGAIVGALYAQHKDIAKVKELLIHLKQDDLVDFSFFQKYAISNRNKLETFLRKNIAATDFASLQIPFIAVATDLSKGEPVYFQKGELHPALFASSALPILFPPYRIGKEIYVDGGVSDPLPVEFARSFGDAIIIASDISPALDSFDAENLLQVLRKSFEVIYQRLSYVAKKKADILLVMNFTDIDSPIDDGANLLVYERGKESVHVHAEEIKQKIPRNLK